MGSLGRTQLKRFAPDTALALMLVLALWQYIPAGCADATDPHDDARCERMFNDPGNVDAFEWLKAPSATPKHLGSLTNEQSLALAYELQKRGAQRINVVVWTDKQVGGTGEASGFVVRLPDDPRQRLDLFRLYAKHVRLYGYAPRADTGQRYLFIPGYGGSGGSLD
jgi:hypothetical protein